MRMLTLETNGCRVTRSESFSVVSNQNLSNCPFCFPPPPSLHHYIPCMPKNATSVNAVTSHHASYREYECRSFIVNMNAVSNPSQIHTLVYLKPECCFITNANAVSCGSKYCHIGNACAHIHAHRTHIMRRRCLVGGPPRQDRVTRMTGTQEIKGTQAGTSNRDHFFRQVQATPSRSVQKCLGRFAYDMASCAARRLWDNSALTYCSRINSKLFNVSGNQLCFDSQSQQGCSSASHDRKHKCSRCGDKSHGAQRYRHVEK